MSYFFIMNFSCTCRWCSYRDIIS